MSLCKEIAAAIQRKTRATARVHPGEDRISVKGRDGVWRDYTSDEAARAHGLKGYMKDTTPPSPQPVESVADDEDDEPITTMKPRTKRRKAK